MLELPLDGETGARLHLERLRDGRLAFSVRAADGRGERKPEELLLLGRKETLTLAGWLADVVEEAWLPTVRERQEDQLRTARDLYGDEANGVERLAGEVLREIPAALLVRAFLLLVNSIGPDMRQRLVSRLNQTNDLSEEGMLRRRLVEEQEAFAYAVAGAALFDAIDRGLAEEK